MINTRMKSHVLTTHFATLLTLLTLSLAYTTANAALIVNIEGVRGSGVTTWTLSGSATFTSNGKKNIIRTGTEKGSNQYAEGDTGEVQGPKEEGGRENRQLIRKEATTKKIIDNKGQLYAVTPVTTPTITVNKQKRTITHIYLNPNCINNSRDNALALKCWGGADYFGIRVNSTLNYANSADKNTTWTGSFKVNLDISNFNPGTYKSSESGYLFASNVQVKVTEKTTTSVPEPASLALFGLALAGLGFSRRVARAREH